MRAILLSLLALIACFRAGPLSAAPRAVLVLRPELTAEAVFAPGSPFAPLLPRAAIGVMNAAVRGPRSPASAYLALGAGERVAAAKAEWLLSDHPRAAAVLEQALRGRGGVTWVGDSAGAGGPQRGPGNPPTAWVPGAATQGGGREAGGYPGAPTQWVDGWWAAVPDLRRPLSSRAALVILDLPPSFAAGRLAMLLARLAQDRERDVLLVSPYPPPGLHGAWDRLPPILGLGPDFPPGDLTSGTTRTPGLVANIDIAPSLLAALRTPIPMTMQGRVMRAEGRPDPAAVLRFARSATLAQRAILPLDVGVGIAAVVPLLLALLLFGAQRHGGSGIPARALDPNAPFGLPTLARATLLVAAAAPLALLLAPLTRPATIPGLGLAVAAWASVAAVAASIFAGIIPAFVAKARKERKRESLLTRKREEGESAKAEGKSPRRHGDTERTGWGGHRARGGWHGVPPPPRYFFRLPWPPPCLRVSVVNSISRFRFLRAFASKDSSCFRPFRLFADRAHSPLLCLYALTVLVIVGDMLLGGRLVERSPLSGFAVAGIRFYGIGNEYAGVLIGMGLLAPLLFEEQLARLRWAQAGFYLGLVALMGSPQFGANLGGPLAAAAGFTATLMLAIRPRRRLPALAAAAGALIATAIVLFLWDALRPPPARSHIGDFVHAVARGGWRAAAPVLRGKAAMSLRLLTSRFALIPIALVGPLLALWLLGACRWLRERLADRPELRAAVEGSVVAAGTALLVKDSGIVPWAFITVSTAAVLLDEQLRSPPTSKETP